MQKELTQTELALRTAQAEDELQRLYSPEQPTYPQEVTEELREALEHLYGEDAAPRDEKLSTNVSADLTEMRWHRKRRRHRFIWQCKPCLLRESLKRSSLRKFSKWAVSVGLKVRKCCDRSLNLVKLKVGSSGGKLNLLR